MTYNFGSQNACGGTGPTGGAPPREKSRKRGIVMRLSARNVLKGTVKGLTEGAVNTEVVVELPGGQEIVSIITKSSAQGLGLTKGKTVYSVIKASNVILAVD
jgi:molybdopterin-binding protein